MYKIVSTKMKLLICIISKENRTEGILEHYQKQKIIIYVPHNIYHRVTYKQDIPQMYMIKHIWFNRKYSEIMKGTDYRIQEIVKILILFHCIVLGTWLGDDYFQNNGTR